MGPSDPRAGDPAAPASRSPGDSLPGRGSDARKRIAAVGAVAVVGLAVHTGVPTAGRLPARVFAAAAKAAPVAVVRTDADPLPVAVGQPGSGRATGHGTQPGQASAFRQIILPDLLLVAPKGLTSAQIASLNKITGLRNMITFDGAQITVGGRTASVIGVNPATFRSWVPLATASDQQFWTALSGGSFVASTQAAASLRLHRGSSYQLRGATTQVVPYAMAASLGLSGVDVLVDQSVSRKLGLVHQVAGLISAPGVSLATLTKKVSKILGAGGRIEVLRSQHLPVATVAPGTRPTTYLQLFKASAAEYCPGLSWTVLAAIGQIESADGTNVGPSSAGAMGPMQFLASTWAAWGIDGFGETGPPDMLDPYDAVPSAARMLCADGAAAGGQSLYNAIFDYNHADWYVNEVLALAAEYAADYQ